MSLLINIYKSSALIQTRKKSPSLKYVRIIALIKNFFVLAHFFLFSQSKTVFDKIDWWKKKTKRRRERERKRRKQRKSEKQRDRTNFLNLVLICLRKLGGQIYLNVFRNYRNSIAPLHSVAAFFINQNFLSSFSICFFVVIFVGLHPLLPVTLQANSLQYTSYIPFLRTCTYHCTPFALVIYLKRLQKNNFTINSFYQVARQGFQSIPSRLTKSIQMAAPASNIERL